MKFFIVLALFAYFALSAAKHRHSITDMQETYSDAKKIKSLNVPDNGMGVGDLNALIKKQIRHINRKKKKERKMKEVSINDWYKFINQLPLSEQILVAFALVFICSTSLFSFVFYIWFVMCFRKSFRYRHVCHQLNTVQPLISSYKANDDSDIETIHSNIFEVKDATLKPRVSFSDEKPARKSVIAPPKISTAIEDSTESEASTKIRNVKSFNKIKPEQSIYSEALKDISTVDSGTDQSWFDNPLYNGSAMDKKMQQ